MFRFKKIGFQEKKWFQTFPKNVWAFLKKINFKNFKKFHFDAIFFWHVSDEFKKKNQNIFSWKNFYNYFVLDGPTPNTPLPPFLVTQSNWFSDITGKGFWIRFAKNSNCIPTVYTSNKSLPLIFFPIFSLKSCETYPN